jgi:hypothetical protein
MELRDVRKDEGSEVGHGGKIVFVLLTLLVLAPG